MGKTDRSELLEYFLAEAEDYLNLLSRGIPELETSTDRTALLEELFRAAHTLKGAAAIVRLNVTSSIAHSMEDILETFKDKQIAVKKDVVDLLLSMLDAVAHIVRDISEGKEENADLEMKFTDQVAEVLAQVGGAVEVSDSFSFMEETSASPITPLPKIQEVVEPHVSPQEAAKAGPVEPMLPEISKVPPDVPVKVQEAVAKKKDDVEYFFGNFVRIDLKKIEDMFNLISEVTIMKNAMLKKTKKAGEISEELLFAGKRLLEEVNAFADRHAYTISDNAKYIDPLFSDFGDLEFDRYDEQNLFSRKLQELTEDITEALKELMQFFGSFQEDIKSLDKIVRFLRTDLSESRMIDIGRLFQRFVRPIKDMGREHDKRVDLHMAGQSTKIDRVIFENLFDPLMHMIRNCISHGIEKGEQRIRSGKRREGTISLSARREGINIIIEITDDGAGIDTNKVFAAAARLSREEILSLIFLPGFSTAGATDMTSGRGVGMNAVRSQISNINGTLELSTEVGKGTSFRIRVPSSLAITNVIVFNYGTMEFVMPTSLIEEVIHYEPVEDKSGDNKESSTMVYHRGAPINRQEALRRILCRRERPRRQKGAFCPCLQHLEQAGRPDRRRCPGAGRSDHQACQPLSRRAFHLFRHYDIR
jgi:chemosensory pili system protein ChpA (sensor histidine kinase/response regulator)